MESLRRQLSVHFTLLSQCFRASRPGRFAVFFLFVASMLAMTSANASTGGYWEVFPPLQIPRQETGAARIGNNIYVVGGLLEGSPLRATDTVEAFDLSQCEWRFIAPLPVALDHMAAVSLNGLLYVIGGYSANFTPRSDMWIYDPSTDEWNLGPPLPSPRGACWAVSVLGRICLFGGIGPSGVAANTFIFDPLNGWSEGAPMPTPREHLTAAATATHAYVIGGRVGGSARAANERYDPVFDSWEILEPLPTARSASGVGILNGRIVVAGGEVPVLSNRVEVYDIAGDSWTCRSAMPVPRHGIAAVTVGDRIFFPGGGTIQGLDPTSHVDAFLDLAPADAPPMGEETRHRTAAFPNPARDGTRLVFSLSDAAPVTITIHDLSGKVVRRIISRTMEGARNHEVTWDLKDVAGHPVSAGGYFYRIATPSEQRGGRLFVLR